MLIRGCKLGKRSSISVVFIVIIIVSFYIISHGNRNSNNEPKIANYYGSNYSYSITFTRFLDFESFLNAKSPDIWIYDSEDEVKDNAGFIAGEILISDTDEKEGNTVDLFQSFEIELIRKSEWNTSSFSMNFDKPKDGITRAPFTAYDFDDSEGNIYDSAILKIGEKEIPIELNFIK